MTSEQFNLRPKVVLILGMVCLFIYGLGEARTPLFLSIVLAYLTFPLVEWLQKHWRLSRGLATTLILLGLIVPVIALLILLIPLLIQELTKLIIALPSEIYYLLTKLEKYGKNFGIEIPAEKEDIMNMVTSHIQDLATNGLSSGVGMLRASVLSVSAFVLVLLNFVLIPVFYIYMTKDYEQWILKFRNLVPPSYRPRYRLFGERTSFILNGYVRGQLLACLVLGVCYGGGLQLAGLHGGWLIGMLTGFFCFIPYLGFSLGFGTAVIVALTQSEGNHVLLFTLLVMGTVQLFESMVIVPRLVGNRVGLTPMEAIVALIVGGNLFGFIGILFAIPMGAFFKEIILIFFLDSAGPAPVLLETAAHLPEPNL